ncbi:MAG: DUF1540 domain-containing protein [Clostridia bacterium]|jgi:hypothetical protein|nr:DUF1540 domain-containing protein [Clostridia bacterium]MBR7165161.1 DUF1540 domain-containing protein [Clostridia bacterium]
MEGITLDSSVPEHIKGIRCNVKNCVYNDQSAYCTARQISVGPSYATAGIDTICGTFRPRNR